MCEPLGRQMPDYEPFQENLADGVEMMNKQKPIYNAISVGLLLVPVVLSGCGSSARIAPADPPYGSIR